ncbi:hypothetical protein DQM07_11280 [Lacticaseibacillus paracasei subsp. paracasei]|uniref:Uncharacterized protein n=3 Tax=Lacticaseibacillus paracasei TaxID=1597 RepID=A0A829GUE2_LACPA|nr:hypothetical protein Lpp123_12436 [Lacticaseibacillus paracasei subsp. paracasei Lpp123]EPC56191.1 hypothetical protein Lpp77_02922 [Lacticaseibacillus paracasei subsp. paracasei CNCM I-4270]EPC64097.1 hypothetical protein Lpl14_10922 [Lacticaseibacillus paracasei subsp. tolerans Lpl14]EPD07251.1 hypothetical protein Lpp78_02686 [Lacticaseibacillus paracasei subsp. paracasei CNCM I-2877]RDV40978.1 hypothetical protein DQM07_11280 [Lacticaseibacillus paracasei subsp. paracasei]RWZ62838.1 hyp
MIATVLSQQVALTIRLTPVAIALMVAPVADDPLPP